MTYYIQDGYTLDLDIDGKLHLDMKKIDRRDPAAAYNRLRQRVSQKMKETGWVLTTRKLVKGEHKVMVNRVQ